MLGHFCNGVRGTINMNPKYRIIFIFILVAAIVVAFLLNILYIKRNRAKERAAQEEMLVHMMEFTGYYQVLYDAVMIGDAEATAKILDVWNKRMDKLSHLRIYFYSIYNNKKGICFAGHKWINILRSWGIMQDCLKEFSISITNQGLYIFDDVYEIGDMAEVITPAWFYSNGTHLKCVEQGVAKVKEQ